MNYQNSYQQYYNRLKPEPTKEERADRFLKRYEAQGGLSDRKRYARRLPIRYTDWINDGSPMPFHSTVEYEPMVELYIPQHRLEELVERDEFLAKLEDELIYYKRIVEMHRNDERIRNDNPTVQKAWQKYLMLLEVCR